MLNFWLKKFFIAEKHSQELSNLKTSVYTSKLVIRLQLVQLDSIVPEAGANLCCFREYKTMSLMFN